MEKSMQGTFGVAWERHMGRQFRTSIKGPGEEWLPAAEQQPPGTSRTVLGRQQDGREAEAAGETFRSRCCVREMRGG